MRKQKHAQSIREAVEKLSNQESVRILCNRQQEGEPMPSAKELCEIIDLCRSLIFPGYFGHSRIDIDTLPYHIGVNTEKLFKLLISQILAGMCSGNPQQGESIESRREKAKDLAAEFISSLPELRRILATDVIAAYNGDPAAESYSEVIFCYPAIRAISNYRIAHRLMQLGVPLIPRIISEMAHSETGIDIHPAATIGEYFTIDHGTGVVIGATAILGNNVKLYQGVTLGAKSFPLDENGNPIKGIARHPIIGDNVIIYSNATILGRITIGEGAVIGGNIWITDSVAPGEVVTQSKAKQKKGE